MALTPQELQELQELEELEELERLEAMERAQKGRAPAPAAASAAKKPEKWYEDFGEGLGVSGLKTYYGLKDLVGAYDDEDRARLADWQADAAESGWGTAGEVLGDVGQVVVPGGGALRAARGLNAVKNATRGLGLAVKAGTPGVMLAADAAGSGLLGAVQAPTGDDASRTMGALEGAGGALLGHGLAKVAGKLVNGIELSPAAKELMEKGIELTPGQAAAGKFVRGLEGAMARLPFTAQGTNLLRDRSLGQWNQVTNNMVRAPGTRHIDEVGFEAQRALRKGYEDAYRDAWAGATKPTESAAARFMDEVAAARENLGPDTHFIFNSLGKQVEDLSANFTPEKMRILDHNLKKASRYGADNGNPYLQDAAADLHKKFRDIVGPDINAKLAPVDAQYRKYLDVQRAAARSGNVSEGAKAETIGNVYRPDQLGSSSRSRVSESRAAGGQGAMQEWAALAQSTIDRKDPVALSSIQQALARTMISPTGALDFGGRLMLGQNAAQKRARDLMQSALIQELRKITPSAAATGGAIWQDD